MIVLIDGLKVGRMPILRPRTVAILAVFAFAGFAAPLVGQAQTVTVEAVEYLYDGFGNRTAVKMSTATVTLRRDADSEEQPAIEQENGIAYSLYPVPAKSTITLRIAGSKQDEQWNIQVVDAEGRLYKSGKAAEGENQLNLSELAPGAYYFMIEKQGERKAWNIIKE